MTILEASSVRVKTLADGTLRAELDFEPRHAADAFKLLGAPGQPVAVAALKPQAQRTDVPDAEPAGKSHEASRWLALRCQEKAFQDWLSMQFPDAWRHAMGNTRTERAASCVRGVLAVESRAECDSDEAAHKRFQHLRADWQKAYMAANA